MVVIYDFTDHRLNYKHDQNNANSSVALALARVVYYAHRMGLQIVSSLLIVTYDCNMLIVKAAGISGT
jgi:hypothetical protein